MRKAIILLFDAAAVAKKIKKYSKTARFSNTAAKPFSILADDVAHREPVLELVVAFVVWSEISAIRLLFSLNILIILFYQCKTVVYRENGELFGRAFSKFNDL